MARAMASAKSMKKASWVVDMGRGIDPLYFPQVYIFQPSFSRAIFTKIWLMFMVKIGGLGMVTQFYGSQDRHTPMQTCAVQTPPKKTSSSHLLDVGVAEKVLYWHIVTYTRFFQGAYFSLDFQNLPNICAIHIYILYTHCSWVYLEDWWSVDLFK